MPHGNKTHAPTGKTSLETRCVPATAPACCALGNSVDIPVAFLVCPALLPHCLGNTILILSPCQCQLLGEPLNHSRPISMRPRARDGKVRLCVFFFLAALRAPQRETRRHIHTRIPASIPWGTVQLSRVNE